VSDDQIHAGDDRQAPGHGLDAAYADEVSAVDDDEFPMDDLASDGMPDDLAFDDLAFDGDEAGAGRAGLAFGAPSGWQPPAPTGVQGVDDALLPLMDLDDVPTAEHVAAYETAHRHLQDALADLDGS